MKFSKILLYDEPAVPEIRLQDLGEFLQRTFRVSVEKRKNVFANATKETATELASIRVFNYRQEFQRHEPTPEEVQFEMETFENTAKTENIILYDGFEFQKIVSSLIPSEDSAPEYFHVVFTNKLTCTFDQADWRYHGRALIGANPSVISTTGIVEAPAKPRQYYLDLMANYGQGLNIESIKKKYDGQYLEYHDPRLGKIIEGYAMQAVFYQITGEPFCDLLECRLNNAHWQRDLLYSQLDFGKLCERHSRILREHLDLNC